MKMKKVLSLIMAGAMVLGTMSMSAFAEETEAPVKRQQRLAAQLLQTRQGDYTACSRQPEFLREIQRIFCGIRTGSDDCQSDKSVSDRKRPFRQHYLQRCKSGGRDDRVQWHGLHVPYTGECYRYRERGQHRVQSEAA